MNKYIMRTTLVFYASLIIAIFLLSACAPQPQQQMDCSDEQTAMHTVLKGLIIAKGGVFQGGC